MTIKIPLTISRGYVSNWGIWEAAREIKQNALDTKDYEVRYEDNRMIIETRAGVLDRKNLLLGISSKRDDKESIGTYGEGFKLALLVLLREGKEVVIKNGADTWTPCFEMHPSVHDECLTILIEENVVEDNENKVVFIIDGLTPEEIEEIQEKTLHNFDKNSVLASYKQSFCWPIESGLGKLYVGGLFVCELGNNYKLNYNFSPDILELDRDRQSVCTFSLSIAATKMIALSGNYDLLAELADMQAEDVSDYYNVESTRYYSDDYTSNGDVSSKIKDVVTENFINSHGIKAYPINASLDEKQKRVQTVKAVDAGLVPVVVKAGYYNMLHEKVRKQKVSDFKSFNLSVELIKFYEENKGQLRGKPKRALEKLLETVRLYEGKIELPDTIKEKVVDDSIDADIFF